jgi:hypothetical protein
MQIPVNVYCLPLVAEPPRVTVYAVEVAESPVKMRAIALVKAIFDIQKGAVATPDELSQAPS